MDCTGVSASIPTARACSQARHHASDCVRPLARKTFSPLVPVTTHTRFHLDSLSKLFTAVAVMQLVEQGRMKLDDPIGRWLDGVQPAWAGITIRHLLTHSSGIVDDYAENFQGSMLGPS